jgi:hypothetical protein
MKKVLLTTTALMMLGGVATAGDMSMSGSISLSYGAWGEGDDAAGADAWTSEADLNVAASSSSGSISMSGTLEIDEDGNPSTGPVSLSSGGFSLVYDANAIDGIDNPDGTTGIEDNYGDYSVSYTAGSLTATYVGDHETADSMMSVSYTAGALTLGMVMEDETEGGDDGETTTTSASYVTGPYTVSLSADDADGWDASVAMASGDTTVTVAADEAEVMSVAVAYTAGDMSITASQEFNEGDDTAFGLNYTAGALTFGAAYDTGNAGDFGSEAETVVTVGYTDGDVSISGQANDQDEMEVSVSFAF